MRWLSIFFRKSGGQGDFLELKRRKMIVMQIQNP